ncbi:hypothetical protein [Moorena sp. SIO3B2]|uniref:Transposase n=2 Tax=Coleofasciculaceae TaxID=1892251 RepID=F4Y308_9CYAN|nr:hypothetical protein [Moorena sp. SIO3B2]EGJ29002.1 hypothetical protein LYNGBM3L_70260 [Moorena producens 3L]NEP33979.1 hypothetical protein [Moorena sp. SIO3B2]NEP69969.1 hypothetical protein [Moorena sp. SIO3A5]OLT66615.1 hypothetical protein BI334_17790 [Moorena producens 3L]
MSDCRGFPHERLHQDNEVYQELRDYGLKPGMKLFLNDLQVTKKNGFGTFNIACKWKRNYRGVKTKEPWYILTNFEDLNTAIVSYKKRFAIEEAMQRGLGEAARSWGSPPGDETLDRLAFMVVRLCRKGLKLEARPRNLIRHRKARLH